MRLDQDDVSMGADIRDAAKNRCASRSETQLGCGAPDRPRSRDRAGAVPQRDLDDSILWVEAQFLNDARDAAGLECGEIDDET